MQPTDPKQPETLCPIAEVVTRWTRRKDARPAEILDAALDLFIEKGFAGTKMEDIARRAGVTAGTIYRYYPGKEDMLKAVITNSLVISIEEGEQIFAACQGNARERLALVVRGWWQLVGATRASGVSKLMLSEAGNFPELARYHREAVIERGEKMIASAIQYGISTGEFRPQPLDIAVKLVVAPVVMAMLWKNAPGVCTTENLDFERYLEAVIETLLFGLGSHSDPMPVTQELPLDGSQCNEK